ncbi:hypothetical protein, partial [Endozoicomonas ascidiicola]|uniref:hypothetical protein n=1 Tax=Endozoicomonas ascidiicola TaxID=1698521 RepID=UPI001C12C4FA
CGILGPHGLQRRAKSLVVNLLVFTLSPVVLASGFSQGLTILRASAANNKIVFVLRTGRLRRRTFWRYAPGANCSIMNNFRMKY